jgi:hypothetical protein
VFILFYIALVALILWGALRNRGEGWLSGLILAILMATIPLWVMGGYYLYLALLPPAAR